MQPPLGRFVLPLPLLYFTLFHAVGSAQRTGPSEPVGDSAPLNAGQLIVELLCQFTDPVVVDLITAAVVEKRTDGGNNGSGSDAPGLFGG